MCLQESRNRPTQTKPPVNVILQARNHTNTVGFKFGPLTVTTRQKVVGIQSTGQDIFFYFMKPKQSTPESIKCPCGGRGKLSSQLSNSVFKIHSVSYPFKEIFLRK